MASPLGRAELHQTSTSHSTSTDSDSISDQKHLRHDSASFDDSHSHSLRQRFKLKVKHALHIDDHASDHLEEIEEDDVKILAPLPEEVDDDLRLDGKLPASTTDKFKSFVKNPVSTVTSAIKSGGGLAVADNIITKEISHAQDVQLVQAQEEKIKAQESGINVEAAEEKVDRLMESRQNMYMRWALDRHVRKVRRLDCPELVFPERQPLPQIPGAEPVDPSWMTREQLHLQDYAHKHYRRYIGVYSEPNPPNQETLTSAVERVILSSAPLQEAYMIARPIYRWEDPGMTLFCLTAFIILWAFDLLLGAVFAGVVIATLYRKSHPPTVESLRQEVKRIEDEDEEALNILEFVEKYGSDGWTDTMFKKLGPHLLTEMADLASMLEVMVSFYSWRNPVRTQTTLVILSVCSAVCFIAPYWLIIKSTTLFLGLWIFLVWPISSKYPQYRYLVSPYTWLFWDIPDHPTWSLARLKIEAGNRKKELLARNPAAEDADELITYQAAYESHQGQLIINSSSIRFKSAVRRKILWEIPYSRLERIEKINKSTRMRSGEDLLFTDTAGETFTADDLGKRNEAFAQIAGYSGIDWQVTG